jgi:hypothetical protein
VGTQGSLAGALEDTLEGGSHQAMAVAEVHCVERDGRSCFVGLVGEHLGEEQEAPFQKVDGGCLLQDNLGKLHHSDSKCCTDPIELRHRALQPLSRSSRSSRRTMGLRLTSHLGKCHGLLGSPAEVDEVVGWNERMGRYVVLLLAGWVWTGLGVVHLFVLYYPPR